VSKLLNTLNAVGSAINGDVRATVESNILPVITIYDGNAEDTGAGLGAKVAAALGIRAGVVVSTTAGTTLTTVGQPARFEPLRAALLAGGLLVLGALLVRLIRR